ncbi:MAG: AMP-binding protein, partial [Acidimicrobiales bacterium]
MQVTNPAQTWGKGHLTEAGSTAELLRRRAGGPDRTAYVEGATGRRLSWADVAATAQAWAARGDLGGRLLGLHLADPLAMAANFLAALGAGVAIAPLNPGGAPQELARQAAALGLAGVVTDSDDGAVVDALRATGAAALAPEGPQGPAPEGPQGRAPAPGPG